MTLRDRVIAAQERKRNHRDMEIIDCQREAARRFLWASARHPVTPGETCPTPEQMINLAVHPKLRGHGNA